MNLDELKGKTLDDQTHATLVAFVTDLQGKVQQARDESISHRKGLKKSVDEMTALNTRLLEKLGIDSAEELESLPDAKGQADALKQFEAKVKRLERELGEARTATERLTTERNADRRSAAIRAAVGKHPFVDQDVAARLLDDDIQVDGDQIMFKVDGEKLVPLDEGAAWLAKSKPYLVKAQGGAGSGYRGGDAGGGAQPKRPERKDYTDEVAYFRDAAKYHEQMQQAS